MEIKVNDYVRLKNGEIDKVFALCGMIENTIHLEKHKWIGQDCIIKYSNNIIDLIECGDYVNGKLVSNVDEIDNKTIIEWENGDMYSTEIEKDSFIKSIVTHEQFSSLEYIT